MVLGGAQLAIGGMLATRAGYISIAQNERYSLLAESNRVNLTLIPPRRGWVVDRFGKPLAINRTVFRVDIIPDRLREPDRILGELQKLLALTADDLDRIRSDIDEGSGFQPVEVAENISVEQFAAVSIRVQELPGVAPAEAYSRSYPEGAAVGHLLGYVGAASAKAYEESKDPLLLTPGFKVGKEGLERMFEPILRGEPGARRSEVTARGKLVRDLAKRADVPGKTLHLSIDGGLQAYASRRMGDQSSSLVCIDCQTGGILAMASMPCYDPNSFSKGISHLEWDMFSHDDHLPLINKSLQGLFPPGSTSKPMTSLGFLQAGIDPLATINCTGSYKVGGSLFHCSQRRGHGPIAMHEAIVKSCDIYFYHFARLAGIASQAAIARKLGLGEKFDLPVPSQSYGTVPDPEWLLRRYKKSWSMFDTVNSSIGQGYMLANPLQLALMTARIASGRKLEPYLTAGNHPKAPAPLLDVSTEHMAFVRDALLAVVNSGRGTASVARLPVPGVLMAGKTGTAQVRRISMAERAGGVRSNASLAWKQRDHSLFVAYAPADAPRYAMGCIVEHGGFGASAAAPLVRDSMTYLFDPDKAMALLEAQERAWGGTIKERMDRKSAAWAQAHSKAPTETVPPPDNSAAPEIANLSKADVAPPPAKQDSAPVAVETLPDPPSAEPTPILAPGFGNDVAPQ